MARDSAPERWSYPPHTKAKHQILAFYLDAWYPILASWSGRVLFLDGFAGRGRYTDDSKGSPIIALQHLLNHKSFNKMKDREFVFLFIEANKENAESLRKELEYFKSNHIPWPRNVQVLIRNAKFDQAATEIIEYLREQKTKLAPTFAFIDPFGYSGLPMELLSDLLSHDHTEIFVNFMVNHVNRFITRDGQEKPMRELFGIDVRDILADFREGGNRIEHLRQVYESQLRERVGFKYVRSFAMVNDTGNVGYYLIHGTRHIKGVEAMKRAMWKVDPGNGNRFSDRLAGEQVLFNPKPDLEPLRRALIKEYRGNGEIRIEDIEIFTLTSTPYRETHVRSALRPLEADGTIEVRRLGKRGFPPRKTWITFNR